MTIKQIKSLVQFSRGNSLTWDALTVAIPDGVVTFSLDDGIFKLGNGVDVYSTLPTLFTYAELSGAIGGASALFDTPALEENGEMVTVALIGDELKYTGSGTTLSSLLSALDTLEANNLTQDTDIAALVSAMLNVDVSVTTATDGNIITISGGKYVDSGQTIAGLTAAAEAQITSVPGPHLEEPRFYTTADKEVEITSMGLSDNSTVYCDVIGFHDDTDTPVFGLTTNNPDVTITNVSGSLFSLTIAGATSDDGINTPIVLIASIDDGTGNSSVSKAIVCNIRHDDILVTIYGGTGTERFMGVTIDSIGNIICVGETNSEGYGDIDCLIIKFDNNLNILYKKYYGSSNGEKFVSVVTNSADDIIACGYGTAGSALVVRFSPELVEINHKFYSGSGTDYFQHIAIDSVDNVVCAGYTTSEGQGSHEMFIIKFDYNLQNKLVGKTYGGSVSEIPQGIAVDSADNIYMVGRTSSEGTGTYSALVIKFDSDLNILARKIWHGASNDYFQGVAVDSAGNIFCCGFSYNLGNGTFSAFVVKFSSDLSTEITCQIFSSVAGQGNEFNKLRIDSEDNVFCTGQGNSEGLGSNEAFVVKYDNNLNLLYKKLVGGVSPDVFQDVAIDSNGNVFCAGYTKSEGLSSNETTMVVKFPKYMPSGTSIGTVLSDITFQDSTAEEIAGSQTLTDSSLTLGTSSLTLSNPGFNSAESNLTQESDIVS